MFTTACTQVLVPTNPPHKERVLATVQLALLRQRVVEPFVHAAPHLHVEAPVHLGHRLAQEQLRVERVLFLHLTLARLQTQEGKLQFPSNSHYVLVPCKTFTLLRLQCWGIYGRDTEGIGVLPNVARHYRDGADQVRADDLPVEIRRILLIVQ